jgi:hypothetical protein
MNISIVIKVACEKGRSLGTTVLAEFVVGLRRRYFRVSSVEESATDISRSANFLLKNPRSYIVPLRRRPS